MSSARYLRLGIRTAGALALAIALAAFAGWQFDVAGLRTLGLGSRSMPFDTAVLVIVASLALLATTLRRARRATKVLGAVVVILAGALLAEHLFQTRLWPADLAGWLYLGPEPASAKPGFSAAVALLITGIALTLHVKPMGVVRAVVIGLLGAVVIALAAVAIFADTLALGESLPWLGDGSVMAVPGSLGLAFIGLGLATLAWFTAGDALPPRGISLVGGALGLLLTALLWQASVQAERHQVQTQVRDQTEVLRDAAAVRLADRVNALERTARRWDVSGRPDQASWQADAALIVEHAGDYGVVWWCDATERVRWMEPQGSPEAVIGGDPNTTPERRAAFERARASGHPAITPIHVLRGGTPGFLIVVPVHQDGRFDGVVTDVVRADAFFAHLVQRDRSATIAILQHTHEAFVLHAPEVAASAALAGAPLPVGGGTDWRIRIVPGARFFEHERSLLPMAILGAGVAVSLLIAAVGLLLESSLRQGVYLRAVHKDVAAKSVALAEQAEALVQARDAALSAARTKSLFLATMSHEIRTPMNGILGIANLLADTGTSDDQRRLLQSLQQSSESLLTIINDVLDYSKIEAGRLTLERTVVTPRAVVEDALGLLGVVARNKGLTLASEIAPEVPAAIWGDAGRLRQVLLNLIGNAIKFTDQGGITVSVRPVEETAETVTLRLAVTDTGIGIDDDTQARLFQAFSQADASTTRKYGGTGLGLAICRQLAELMGGAIGIQSASGVGSTFWFTVRLERMSAAEQAVIGTVRAPEPVASTASLHVLLVEDTPVNQLVARRMLGKLGHQVTVANNGLEAVAAVAASRFDVVLMDCLMPEIDGFEATRRIRAAEVDAHVPIVALTASVTPEDRKRCIDAGMDAFVSKPVNLAELSRVLACMTMAEAEASGEELAS